MGMAFVIDDARLGGDKLVILLPNQRPPLLGEQVAEHQIYLHSGNAQAERKYILIADPFFRRQVVHAPGG